MKVYQTVDGDKITVEANQQGIKLTSDLKLTVHDNSPDPIAAHGELQSQSAGSTLEDLFHENVQFDIEVELASGKKEFNGCMAVSGSPNSIEWQCAPVNR
ncbi:hypothetical protein [Haloarchaeobius amylolyticus]|uniref:hypothetical protein n=1 Tax=Haloarchaeobius amylolyticus TaxID=1198296 RepID=UPI00227082FE|nr:hypothetical protein [Haloarchaeobius amylolyticus]